MKFARVLSSSLLRPLFPSIIELTKDLFPDFASLTAPIVLEGRVAIASKAPKVILPASSICCLYFSFLSFSLPTAL